MQNNAVRYDSRNIIGDSVSQESNSLADNENLGWWIEIFTAQPACIYFFGGFESAKTAQEALPGFTEDLLEEGASGLVARIGFHNPCQLTIDLEEAHSTQMTHFPPGVDIL